jgi:acetolactate synthase-1/2/3 large subunit
LFYGGRFVASRFHAAPDFVALARAFGMSACDLGPAADPAGTLARALARRGPGLIRVPIAADANVYPMVPPGAPNRDMIAGDRHDQPTAA